MSAAARRSRALPAALLLAAWLWALPAAAQAGGFGFKPGAEGFSAVASAEGGVAETQAGAHPYELTTTIDLKMAEGAPEPGGPYTEGDLRDLQIEEPPGLIEDPAALDQCSLAQFHTPRTSPFEQSASGESCPARSQVGVVAIRSNLGASRSFGVFNLAPPPGFPSQLGFAPYGVPITLTPQIRQAGGEYGISLELRNLSQRFDLEGMTLTLWGVPWAIAHNTERGNCLNEANPEDPWAKCSPGRPAFNPPKAYLSLPSSCTGPLTTRAAADSWQRPGAWLPSGEPDLADPAWAQAASRTPQGLGGCEHIDFSPAARARPVNPRAASPTGLALEFEEPDEGLTKPALTAPAQPKRAVVTLPEGMTLNPSLAAGLGACSPAAYAAESASSPPGSGCPNSSKIGDFIVESPLYPEALEGAIFLAQPFENPFGQLLALYIVARSPQRGLLVKVAGELRADPASGRLVGSFDGLPQLPYARFRVLFRESQRSPLLNPPTCGTYQSEFDLHPWLDPAQTLHEISPFAVASGIEGPCPSGAAPFAPAAAGGSLNPNAGSYSPFYLHLTRTDREQEITSYSATLPPGLLGRIAGVPFCPEAEIAAAKQKSGTEETESPSCPAASQIGRTVAGYGVGPALAYAPGRLYLAGPYHGSPLSVVAIDSATLGPFDLGVVIVRSAIRIDPRSAQVSIDSAGSDPIPHIIDGIPIHLRDIRVYIDRPQFTINPTDCAPLSLSSTLTGSTAPFTNPRDTEASATARFQVSNCAALRFAPRFAMRLRGGARRGGYPELTAVYTPRPGEAGIAAARVTLPPTLFLAQAHIGTVCTRPQLEAEACPPGSLYGRARAVTPLLGEAMTGGVYLVSSRSGQGLPELLAVLHGEGIRILLEGSLDSVGGGIRASFAGLPDAPVTKFTMTIFGGARRGILESAANLCARPQLATARFFAQDEAREALRPRLGVHCRHRGGRRGRGR